jgi:hypothetical protein
MVRIASGENFGMTLLLWLLGEPVPQTCAGTGLAGGS